MPRSTAARFLLALALLGPADSAGSRAEAAQDASPLSATAVLTSAFHVRYDCDLRMTVDLRVRVAGAQVLARRLDVVTREIGGRMHTLAVFTEPAELRRTKLLTVENEARSDDQFIYLPSLRRVRRVSSAQRADAFMGTDLAYEDFERRRAADYEAELLPSPPGAAEPVLLVSAHPRFESSYDRVEFVIARSDSAMLASRYYKRGAAAPFKQATMPRRSFRREGDCMLPTELLVENLAAGTSTQVRIENLASGGDADERLFSSRALEERDLLPEPAAVQ